MENKNGILDVSSFFLVEDSGDSELDCGSSMATVADAADEDDAESCSFDDTITTERSLDDFYEVILQLDDDDEDHQDSIDCRHWSSGNVGSLDEAIGSYNISAGSEPEDRKKPRFGINLCREVMDGLDDRLFWETCMAVGYPMN